MQTYTVTIRNTYDASLPVNAAVEAISRDNALAKICPGFDDLPTAYTTATVRTVKGGKHVMWRRAPRIGWEPV